MIPAVEVAGARVFLGDCREVLGQLPDNSVDSIVTDPPYELGFMGKSWDSSGVAYDVNLWMDCFRVLKPGGHLLAFGGSRTWHRLAVAVEDAGFELRDSIAWLYGSGFPKSLNVSKAIESTLTRGSSHSTALRATEQAGDGESYQLKGKNNGILGETRIYDRKEFEASTSEAKEWKGWGTALKPAFEPVVVGRKPLVGTVAENVLEWGVGGLNIDGSRIPGRVQKGAANNFVFIPGGEVNDGYVKGTGAHFHNEGRWPANVILDEVTAGFLDEQSGVSKSGKPGVERIATSWNANTYGAGIGKIAGQQRGDFGDSGGASRFFYVAKASKRDRNEGLEGLEGASSGGKGNGLARVCETCGASILKPCDCPERSFVNPQVKNFHPTVKPTQLMRYLIKLVTPPGGTVLDPFTGSGSTGKAALLDGFGFVGAELTEEYLPIIEGRLRWASEQVEETDDTLF